MKGHGKNILLISTAVLLSVFCAFGIADTYCSDGDYGYISIADVSLTIDDGNGEWCVRATGWTGTMDMTYTVFQGEEELYSVTGSATSNEDYRFGNSALPIWKGAEYTIGLSADGYLPSSRSYTTLTGAILLGSPSMEVGEKNALKLVTTPSDASCSKYEWVCSDTSIATVDGGVVSATGTGTVYVKAISLEDTGIETSEFEIRITDSSETSGYRIDVSSNEGGTATADKTRAFPGEWVELHKTADEGYEFIDWETNTPITVIDDYAAFKMPAYAVKIKAIFRNTYPEDMAVRENDNGAVLIPLTLLESKGMRNDENLKAEINKVTEVPSNIPESAVTYSVTVSYNGVEFTNLGGSITVILDFENKSGSEPAVYSVSDDGSEVYRIGGEYSPYAKTMAFQAGKLTLFAVSCESIEPVVIVDNSAMTYVCIFAVFIIAMVGAILFFKR